jgi:hypothetical protein
MLKRRATLAAELRSARQAVARLVDRRVALDRLYEQTRAAWDYERYTGVSDGVINIIDLSATLLNPSASTALAGVLSAVKQGAKDSTRSAIAAFLGIRSRHQPGVDDILLSGLGIPTGIGAPGGALKQALVNQATRQSRGYARQALDLNRRRSLDAMRRASRSAGRAQSLGQGLNVIESGAALGHDFGDHATRAAALRRRMTRIHQQRLAIDRALETAQQNYQVARHAYQANEDAIRQLAADFPAWFPNQ